jgi:hypothetical protein
MFSKCVMWEKKISCATNWNEQNEIGHIWSIDKYSLIFHSDHGPCSEFKEARVKYCSLWGEVVGRNHVEEHYIILTAVYAQEINKLWLGQIQGSGIACSIRLPVAVGGPGNGSVAPVFVLQGLRFSQQCCCRFEYFGLWRCVTGYVVPAVLRGCTAFIFSFWPWRWRHCDALKCWELHTQHTGYGLHMWRALSHSQTPCCLSLSLQSPELDVGSWWGSSLSLSFLNNCICVLSACLSLNYIAFLNCTISFKFVAWVRLNCQNFVPNLDQRNVKALYLLYSSHLCNYTKHSHAILECCRYGLHMLEASVHSQSWPRIFMVDKVALGQVFVFSTLSLPPSL